MEDICFSEGSVPVCIAAKVYGKDASWIRAGIIVGWLPIGKATRKGRIVTRIEEMDSKYGRINFYKGLCITALIASVTLNVITLQHYGVIPKLQFKKKNDIKA